MSGIIITLVYQATHPVTYSFRGYKKSVTAGQISFKFYKLANLAKQSIGVLQIQMTSNGMDLGIISQQPLILLKFLSEA